VKLNFLFGHEVLHCVYDHFGRRGDRDPKIWNIANDFCVNADLVEAQGWRVDYHSACTV
jgi:predicted metal-dependent peptidase